MKESVPAYAIIRIDTYTNEISNLITVKEIVPTLEKAESEVRRLTEINCDKECKYFWQTTRIKKKYLGCFLD